MPSRITAMATRRLKRLLAAAGDTRVLVIGDVILDQFIWGRVGRISPEAPVPVVEFERESFMPGGAANIARNLTALGASAALFGVVGRDEAANRLAGLLRADLVDCRGLLPNANRRTSIKTRIIAHQQQVVRIDREDRGELDPQESAPLMRLLRKELAEADAVIVGDYDKGVVTQRVLDELRQLCRAHGVWLSLDPKPVHRLDLGGLSLITPNRKEALELARLPDGSGRPARVGDIDLLSRVGDRLLSELRPALLLITLGEQGMLLHRHGQKPFHIPTAAREVFDVSGAGDTVIASFTLAIAAGASPVEAAVFSNYAAGVVVGKVGTAAVSPAELRASFERGK